MSKQKGNHILFWEDILTCIENFEDFGRNEMAVDAVIRSFEIIGEAAKGILEEIKKQYPHGAWQDTAGFRKVLTHDYFGID